MECTVHRLVADVTILSGNKTLLVKYRDTTAYDGEHGWFVPDDLLRHGEHPADAAMRILQEQIGLDAAGLRLAYIESFDGGRWHLVFHHVLEVDEAQEIPGSGNVETAQWFDLDALPTPQELAHHGWTGDIVGTVAAERP